MRTAIIFSGNTGTCELVANMISKKLNHGYEIFDTSKRFYIDFDEFDNFVLGTNVRYGRLNKRFKRLYTKMKTYTTDKQNYFVYICGAEKSRAEDYIASARDVIDTVCDYYFVGGEIKTNELKGMAKLLAKSYQKTYNAKYENSPEILYENIDKLTDSINEMENED